MQDPPALELSLAQRFDIEHHTRVIDSTNDLGELRRLTKQLLQAWHTQKAATVWVMRQQLDSAHRLAFATPPGLRHTIPDPSGHPTATHGVLGPHPLNRQTMEPDPDDLMFAEALLLVLVGTAPLILLSFFALHS